MAGVGKSFRSVRGMRDLFMPELSTFARIRAAFSETTRCYAFEEIETPVLEQSALFHRALGEASDVVIKEMYRFEDLGGTDVTLRPEGTAGAMRAVLQRGGIAAGAEPGRFAYWGPMFRYERPQQGRFRQFTQAGLECIGGAGAEDDVAVLAAAASFLQRLGLLHGVQLQVNTLGDAESRAAYASALARHFDANAEKLSSLSRERIARGSPLRVLDSKEAADTEVIAGAPAVRDTLTTPARQRYEGVCQALDAVGIAWVENPRLVRGLDYYSHTIFEFVARETPAEDGALATGSAVLAGGRYDGLASQIGRRDVPAVGWAAGVDRLARVLDAGLQGEAVAATAAPFVAVVPVHEGGRTQPPPEGVWASEEVLAALRVAERLRGEGHRVKLAMHRPSLAKLVRELGADGSGCVQAVFVGGSELADGNVSVKTMATRETATVPLDRVAEHVC